MKNTFLLKVVLGLSMFSAAVGVVTAGVSVVDNSVGDNSFNQFERRHGSEIGQSDANWDTAMAADRPTATANPLTVQAGRWQIEMTTVGFSHNDDGGVETEGWTFVDTTLKYGLTDSTELQLTVTPWATSRTRSGNVVEEADGFGDVIARFKWTAIGDRDSNFAAAIMPYAKIPTDTDVSSDKWEYGIIFPIGMSINDWLSFGAQADVGYRQDDTIGQYWSLGHAVVLAAALNEKTTGYIEYVGTASELPYESAASTGLIYSVNDDFAVDVAALFGLNDNTDDFAVFTGFSKRF